jgi:hypothetical protein
MRPTGRLPTRGFLNKSNHPGLVIASESEASKAFIIIIEEIQFPGFHYLGSFTAAIKPGLLRSRSQ